MRKKDSIEIIAEKSKDLLSNQIAAFDSNYGKAGTFISISSLFTPLAFTIYDKFDYNIITTIIFFIPISLNLFGLFFLLKVLIPKKIKLWIWISRI